METPLRERLFAMADTRYRDFIAALTPGAGKMIGVRLPLLRKIARETARGDWRRWLDEAEEEYFEEKMLQGLTIGYAQCPPEEKLRRTADFMPKIDNWAVCDCCCWRLKAAEREPMWRFLQPYFRSQREYEARFAVVMALSNFIDEEHIDRLLEILGAIRHEGYYVHMGVAWAVSVCYVKFPERTLRFLQENCPLPDRTYNKALQKIVESLRVNDADKATIRALKRRAK